MPPVGTTNRALAITNAFAIFNGGNLSASFSNEVKLMANNTVSNASANKLVLTITKASGLFNGSVVDPASGKTLKFKVAVLQKQRAGSGFFLGTNQSGGVYFGP
jgi:uncharacterized protein (DUF2147 family)